MQEPPQATALQEEEALCGWAKLGVIFRVETLRLKAVHGERTA